MAARRAQPLESIYDSASGIAIQFKNAWGLTRNDSLHRSVPTRRFDRDVVMCFTIISVVSCVQTIAAGSGIRERSRLSMAVEPSDLAVCVDNSGYAAARTDNFNPATRRTATSVDSRGLPAADRERYRLSRLSPAASATRDMPCASAMRRRPSNNSSGVSNCSRTARRYSPARSASAASVVRAHWS